MNQHAEYSFKDWSPVSNILGSYSQFAMGLPKLECIDAFIFYKSDEMLLATSRFQISENDDDYCFGNANPFHKHPCFVYAKMGDVASHSFPSELYDRELYMTEAFSIQSAYLNKHPIPSKLRSMKRCLLFENLFGKVEEDLVQALTNAPTKWSYFHVLHGGEQVREISPKSTSFSSREWNFAVVIIGRWPDGDLFLQERTVEWVKSTTEKLIPSAAGIYSADLGPNDKKLTHLAYEKRNLISLSEAKRKNDPLMILRHSCPLIGQPEMTLYTNAGPLSQSRGVVGGAIQGKIGSEKSSKLN